MDHECKAKNNFSFYKAFYHSLYSQLSFYFSSEATLGTTFAWVGVCSLDLSLGAWSTPSTCLQVTEDYEEN